MTVGALLLFAVPFIAAAQSLSPHQRLARDIHKELVEINTVTATGDTAKAAEAMAARLRSAGFPAADVRVFTPAPRKGNLVARLRGSGAKKPILLLAHIDVVEAKREDWSLDPFKLTEKDGYFYGRGTSDDKDGATTLSAAVLRLRQENFKPNRDVILMLTAGEEGGEGVYNGAEWLIESNRALVNCAFALNADAGGVEKRKGKRMLYAVQAAEKVYQSYRLEVKGPGGHSSQPGKDNTIYRLAEGLVRLSKYEFPVKLSEITRGYFEKMSQIETGPDAEAMKAVLKDPPDEQAI